MRQKRRQIENKPPPAAAAAVAAPGMRYRRAMRNLDLSRRPERERELSAQESRYEAAVSVAGGAGECVRWSSRAYRVVIGIQCGVQQQL